MNSGRKIRNTKVCVFLYTLGLILIVGVISFYNNTLTQLEQERKSNEYCRQQEDNLATQLQVISEYKQRLEQSLKAEKVENQRARQDTERRFNSERLANEKTVSEANLRYTALQQQLNLLQTQNEDLKENCSSSQISQLDQINTLQRRLDEVSQELKRIRVVKTNLQEEFRQLQIQHEQDTSTNRDLQKKLDLYELNCPNIKNVSIIQQRPIENETNNRKDQHHLDNVGEVPPLDLHMNNSSINKRVLAVPFTSSTSRTLTNMVEPIKIPILTTDKNNTDSYKPALIRPQPEDGASIELNNKADEIFDRIAVDNHEAGINFRQFDLNNNNNNKIPDYHDPEDDEPPVDYDNLRPKDHLHH